MAEVIVIEPGRYERNYWRDLWRYRELFRVLAWRDLAVRYKQTVIGIAWAVIRPFLTMLVLLISGRAIRWNSSLYRVVMQVIHDSIWGTRFRCFA
jgi:lipopolysaccharide transport system permease protein